MPVSVAARPGKAGDQTKLDRVFGDRKTIGIVVVAALAASAGRIAAERSDNGHVTADQVGHQRRQAIELALRPTVFDRHVLALDVAGFVQALSESQRRSRTRPATGR